jgi:two-component system OmpR family response regulator
MRVLLIEDDRETAHFLQKSLKESGHSADVAGDGETGLSMAQTNSYDVLIVDRMLPKLDGLIVVKTLRSEGDRTPVLILSALGDVDDRVKGLRAGEPIQLQPREFRLLEYLMKNAGQVVTRTMLLENVWDYHFDPQTNVIDVHVSRLRSKIDKGFERPLLHTVRGAGYMVRDGAL